MEIPGLNFDNNTTGILEQTKSISWSQVSRETDIKSSGPDHLMNTFEVGAIIEIKPRPTGVQ